MTRAGSVVAPNNQINVILKETDRTVAQHALGASRMIATKGELYSLTIRASRILARITAAEATIVVDRHTCRAHAFGQIVVDIGIVTAEVPVILMVARPILS